MPRSQRSGADGVARRLLLSCRHPSSARSGMTPSTNDHQTTDEVTPMPYTIPLKRITTTFSVFIILAMTVLSPAAGAQVAGATLSGTISDASGAVIPGAMVSIRDTATGIIRTVSSDEAGLYTAANLRPSTYGVTVSISGFNTRVQSGITLTVGAQQVLDFVMQVGQTTEAVEVTGEAPLVQLATSTLSATVESNTVRELPLNGRDWTALATLQPGVASVRSQQTPQFFQGSQGARGLGMQLPIGGTRPTQERAQPVARPVKR